MVSKVFQNTRSLDTTCTATLFIFPGKGRMVGDSAPGSFSAIASKADLGA